MWYICAKYYYTTFYQLVSTFPRILNDRYVCQHKTSLNNKKGNVRSVNAVNSFRICTLYLLCAVYCFTCACMVHTNCAHGFRGINVVHVGCYTNTGKTRCIAPFLAVIIEGITITKNHHNVLNGTALHTAKN